MLNYKDTCTKSEHENEIEQLPKQFTKLWFLIPVLCLPQRYIMAIMGFLALVNAYTMRVCLNIAIVEMVGKIEKNETVNDEYCSIPDNWMNPKIENNDVLRPFDWSERLQGFILGVFFVGYLIGHVPGGVLADRFGGKYTLSLGILSTSIFTLITPVVVIYAGAYGLLVLRFLEGLGEGSVYPALSVLLTAWIPLKERNRVGPFVLGAAIIGTIITNLVSGWILHTFEWDKIFYIFGFCGVLWCIIFELICFSNPASHPYIKDKERDYLEKELGKLEKGSKKIPTPWRHMFTSKPFWALIAGQIGHDWGYYVMISDLPKYMNDALHFQILQNGLYSSIPFIFMWIISVTAGFFNDWLLMKQCLTIKCSRKLFTTIASMGPAVFIILASYAGCRKALTVVCFTFAMGLMGFFFVGLKINILDLSPNHAGAIMGVVNGLGSLAGAAAPTLVGFLTEDKSVSSWRIVFWVTFCLFLITNICYYFWASAEVQYWDDPDNLKKKDLIHEES